MARVTLNPTKKDNIYWYKDKNGKKKYAYRYKYYDVFKKRREKTKQGFNSEIEAEKALIELKSEILNGGEKFVEYDSMTIEKWFKVWYESKKSNWRSGTQELHERTFRDHIQPYIGKMRLNKITNMYIQRELINPLIKKELSRNTIKRILTLVNTMLNSATQEGILKSNPITNVDYSKAPHKKYKNYLDEEDLERWLKCVHEYDPTTYYTAILTLAFTGIRKGELAGLRWYDIDFKNNTITINRSRRYTKLGPPKSDNGYRTIQVHQTLIDQLKKYKAWCTQVKWSKNKTLSEEDYVFINRYTYEPIGETYLNEALYAINAEYKDLPKITPHGLRHTFSSILIANKTPVITVAKLIGDHPTTVNNIYSHSLKEAENKVVEIFDYVQAK